MEWWKSKSDYQRKNLKSGFDTRATGILSYEVHINIKDKLFLICSPYYKNCQELDQKAYFKENE